MKTSGKTVHVSEAGLLIDAKRLWSASSVDGLCEDSSSQDPSGLVEIKCPYTTEDLSLSELASQRSNFYLKQDSNGVLKMNKNHNYHSQVQHQMGVTARSWCDFVVYLKNQHRELLFVECVDFDEDYYMTVILPKTYKFFCEGVVPELLTNRIKRGM